MEKLSFIPLMITYMIYNNNKRANHAGNKHYEDPTFPDGKDPASIFFVRNISFLGGFFVWTFHHIGTESYTITTTHTMSSRVSIVDK